MTVLRRPLGAAVAVAVAAVGLTLGVGGTAHADSSCENEVSSVAASDLTADVTWAQQLFNMKRVWPMATGDGVTVAVLDSGVQADHPVLDGRVLSGKAYIDAESQDEKEQNLGDGAVRDCLGHGTGVAGIIAGGKSEEGDFYGLAPDAKILPVRVSNQDPNVDRDDDDEPLVTADDVADAIRWAADQNVDVINMSLKFTEDHGPLRSAVEYAIGKGSVVVASGGNDGDKELPVATAPVYPASYPGVIGVGAVDATLTKTAQSQWGPWIDVVAPGISIAAPQHDGDYQNDFGGTSGAAAFVSGTVALLAELFPDWEPQHYASQIIRTASHVAGPTPSLEYGNGLVDPYRAVTERLTDNAPVAITEVNPPVLTEEQAARHEDFAWMNRTALIIGLSAVAAFFITVTGVAALRRGRRVGWRIGKASKEDMIEPTDDGDPISLFQGIKGLKQ
ncbi:MAG TPA: type VII secretion-associated serine protease mycosin [Candidatus Stackebrandtia excrementipullorum]|nr:type VII secretion-associated serine protease mycosin [Candidatus Stackebrandtia excrementipullorum]